MHTLTAHAEELFMRRQGGRIAAGSGMELKPEPGQNQARTGPEPGQRELVSAAFMHTMIELRERERERETDREREREKEKVAH